MTTHWRALMAMLALVFALGTGAVAAGCGGDDDDDEGDEPAVEAPATTPSGDETTPPADTGDTGDTGGDGEVSAFREQVEAGIRSAAEAGGAPPEIIECVIQRLREEVTDEQLQTASQEELQQFGFDYAQECQQ